MFLGLGIFITKWIGCIFVRKIKAMGNWFELWSRYSNFECNILFEIKYEKLKTVSVNSFSAVASHTSKHSVSKKGVSFLC